MENGLDISVPPEAKMSSAMANDFTESAAKLAQAGVNNGGALAMEFLPRLMKLVADLELRINELEAGK